MPCWHNGADIYFCQVVLNGVDWQSRPCILHPAGKPLPPARHGNPTAPQQPVAVFIQEITMLKWLPDIGAAVVLFGLMALWMVFA